jgi:hypothetical protein
MHTAAALLVLTSCSWARPANLCLILATIPSGSASCASVKMQREAASPRARNVAAGLSLLPTIARPWRSLLLIVIQKRPLGSIRLQRMVALAVCRDCRTRAPRWCILRPRITAPAVFKRAVSVVGARARDGDRPGRPRRSPSPAPDPEADGASRERPAGSCPPSTSPDLGRGRGNWRFSILTPFAERARYSRTNPILGVCGGGSGRRAARDG